MRALLCAVFLLIPVAASAQYDPDFSPDGIHPSRIYVDNSDYLRAIRQREVFEDFDRQQIINSQNAIAGELRQMNKHFKKQAEEQRERERKREEDEIFRDFVNSYDEEE